MLAPRNRIEVSMAYVIPAGLTLLALLVAGLGVRLAHKARRPRLLKSGAIIAGTGLMLLWLLPWWAISQHAGAWSMPLMVAALFVAVSVLGGGLSAMARAATGKAETREDHLFHDFVQLNDLP